MAFCLTRFSWRLLGGNDKTTISKGSSINSSLDWGIGLKERDVVKLPSVKKANFATSNRKIKRKWKSREERRVDKEYDVVLVPSDGVGLSGSESDDSDWSIGWLEPHAPDFQSDDEADDSFAVLVPCYKQELKELEEKPSIWYASDAMRNIPNEYSDGKKSVEQWLSSLQNC